MTPGIEQHLELLVVTLAVTLGLLNRLLKKRNGRLRLTLSVTEESSNDCPRSTKPSQEVGKKADSSDAKQQHTKQRGSD